MHFVVSALYSEADLSVVQAAGFVAYDDGQFDARALVMPGRHGNRHTVRLPL